MSLQFSDIPRFDPMHVWFSCTRFLNLNTKILKQFTPTNFQCKNFQHFVIIFDHFKAFLKMFEDFRQRSEVVPTCLFLTQTMANPQTDDQCWEIE